MTRDEAIEQLEEAVKDLEKGADLCKLAINLIKDGLDPESPEAMDIIKQFDEVISKYGMW